jgi:hypothetical protein
VRDLPGANEKIEIMNPVPGGNVEHEDSLQPGMKSYQPALPDPVRSKKGLNRYGRKERNERNGGLESVDAWPTLGHRTGARMRAYPFIAPIAPIAPIAAQSSL